MEPFKISFENVRSGKTASFFINGIDGILSQEYFNVTMRDAKTGEEFTIKSSILKQLSENKKKINQLKYYCI